MEARVPARLSPAEGRRFGLTLGAAFLVLAGICWWREREGAATVAFVISSVLLLAGTALPTRLGPVQRAWLGLGTALSRVTTPIFLGATYFGAIAPIGLLLRAFGRNPLTRHRRPASCWVIRPDAAWSRSDMERQF